MNRKLQVLLCTAAIVGAMHVPTDAASLNIGQGNISDSNINVGTTVGDGTNDKDSTYTSLTVNGNFTNLDTGSITADSLVNNSTLTNNGTVNAKSLTNNSSIDGAGRLTVVEGTNEGTIKQDIVSVTGDLKNNGSIIPASYLSNTGAITADEGKGTLAITKGDNAGTINQNSMTVSGEFNNYNSITSSSLTVNENAKVNNSGTISSAINNSGKISGNGDLTVLGGSNVGTIEQDTISVTGDLENNGSITASYLSNTGAITADEGNGALVITDGGNAGTINQNSITVSGKFNSNNSITSSDLTVTESAVVNNSGAISSAINNSGKISGNGDLTVLGGSNVGTIEQDTVLVKGDLKNNGSITAGYIYNAEDVSITADEGNGTLTITKGDNAGTITQNSITVSGELNNYNSITSSSLTVNENAVVNNSGTVTSAINNSGTINPAYNSGTFNVTGGKNAATGIVNQSQINVTGDFTNDGAVTANTLTNSSSITGDGNLTVADGTNSGTINQNSLTVNGNFTNSQNSTIETTNSLVNNSTLTNNGTINGGDITNNGTINLNSGTLTSNKQSSDLGGSIVSTGESSISLNNKNISGSLVVSDGTLSLTNSNVIADAVVNITSGSSLSLGESTNLALGENDTWGGTVVLNSGSSKLTINNISGAIDAKAGELDINGTYDVNSGSKIASDVNLNLENTGTLNISGGEVALDSQDTWAGDINLSSGTLTATDISNDGKLNATGGNLTLDGAKITIGEGSLIAEAVTLETANDTSLTIQDKGAVTLNTGDKINDTTSVTLEKDGTLNYGMQDAAFNLVANEGNLNLLNGSALTIDSNSSIADKVALDIQNGSKLTLDNAKLNLDSEDHWNGTIDNQGGTINASGLKQNSSTAALIQATGTTNLDKSSVTLGDKTEISGGSINLTNSSSFNSNGASITGGDMMLDKDSSFNVLSGNFKLDSLSAVSDGTSTSLINTMNGAREDSTIGALTIDKQANFNIDIHARSNQNTSNDTFQITSGKIDGDGTARIDQWSLNGDIYGWDAPIDRSITLSNIISDAAGNSLINDNIEVTDATTFTPIGWYQLKQNEVYETDPTTGLPVVDASGNKNHIGRYYSLDLVKYNPQVFRGQVTTLAQWQNQLNIEDMLFTHSMVLPSFKDEDGGVSQSIMANRYAADSPLFAPYQYSRKDGGLWYKMYGTFENLQMNNNVGKVGNNAYGALIGADFGLKELRNGWKFMPTAYIGYNGAHQTFAGVGAYQNGGQAGFLGTWYKNKTIIGGLIYGGVYDNSMDVYGHTDSTFNYFGGAATKAAYNIRLHRDLVLQPNLFLSYNYFGQQNWHSKFGQMGMMASDLNGVNIAPGLNLIWEKETFSAYATLQYMYNINGAVGGRAGNVTLPHMDMQRGYIQYGIGFNKNFSDRFSGYLQAVLRNVGRTGVGLQMGFNWKIGK